MPVTGCYVWFLILVNIELYDLTQAEQWLESAMTFTLFEFAKENAEDLMAAQGELSLTKVKRNIWAEEILANNVGQRQIDVSVLRFSFFASSWKMGINAVPIVQYL